MQDHSMLNIDIRDYDETVFWAFLSAWILQIEVQLRRCQFDPEDDVGDLLPSDCDDIPPCPDSIIQCRN